MDVWSHDRNLADQRDDCKKIGELEGAKQGYRWQFGKLWEISAFPLTKLIMDVPGILQTVSPEYFQYLFRLAGFKLTFDFITFFIYREAV